MKIFFYYLFFLFFLFNFSYAEEVDTLLVNERYNNEDIWKMSLFPSYNMASIGQLGNDKPIKAIVLTGLKYYWYNEYKVAHKALKLSNRSRAMWWFLFLYVYSIIDAAIDSEMESFPENNEKQKESK